MPWAETEPVSETESENETDTDFPSTSRTIIQRLEAWCIYFELPDALYTSSKTLLYLTVCSETSTSGKLLAGKACVKILLIL